MTTTAPDESPAPAPRAPCSAGAGSTTGTPRTRGSGSAPERRSRTATCGSRSSPSTSGSRSGRCGRSSCCSWARSTASTRPGKFFLVAVPTLVGLDPAAALHVRASARFGGRNWTIVSAALLLIPTILAAIVMQPGTPYWVRSWSSPRSAGSAAATSPRRWRTSTPSSPRRKQGLGARAERRRREHRRAGDPAGRPADHRDRRGRRPADPARRLHPADRGRRACSPRCTWTTSPRCATTPAPSRRRSGSADLGDVVPLHRHVRLVHRLQLRVRAGAAEPVRPHPAAGRRGDVHRPAARLADPPGRRLARRPATAAPRSRSGTSSRWPSATGVVHRGLGDRTRWRCSRAGFVLLFVLHRDRQRLHLQDDPGDLPRPGAGRDRGRWRRARSRAAAGPAALRGGDRHRRRGRRARRAVHQPGVPAVVPDHAVRATRRSGRSSRSTWCASW